MRPHREIARAAGLGCGALFVTAAPGAAQDALFIDRGRLDAAPPRAGPASAPQVPPRAAPAEAAPEVALASVAIAGETDPAALDAIAARAAALRGRPLTQETLHALLDAVAAHYRAQDLAFSRALAPAQDFAGGRVRLVVLKGYVSEIAVDGVTGRAARYLRARAAPLLHARPLRTADLARVTPRLAEAPGLLVSAKFEQAGGDPSALRLRISATPKRLAAGASVNNQGQRLLGRTQYEVTVAANALAHPGDRLQFYYGFPEETQRYRFAALSYAAPIGAHGLRAQAQASWLRTRPEGLAVAGDAQTVSVLLSHPVLEAARRSAMASVSLDALDSDNAFLGQLIARERTRVLRTALSYAQADGAARTHVSAAASFGIDAWGARVASVYGGPAFAKLTVRAAHEHAFSRDLSASVRATAQLGARRLPPSERLQFGGEANGRGFAAGFAGSSGGLTARAEAQRRLAVPGVSSETVEARFFAFVDGARLGADAVFAARGRTLASAGVGAGASFFRKLEARLVAAAPVAGAEADGGTKLLFGLSAAF